MTLIRLAYRKLKPCRREGCACSFMRYGYSCGYYEDCAVGRLVEVEHAWLAWG